MILLWLAATALVLAVIGCGYLIAAAILVGRTVRARPAPAASPTQNPDVTILKPLAGDEPGLYDNLASLCAQDYPGRVQIICGVDDPADGAVAVVERLQKAHPACDLALVIETKAHGSNRKVGNLINMAPRIAHDVVVIADSDIRVAPDYLARVVAALPAPGVGAVTCLYYGAPIGAFWPRLSALAINAHFLPSVIVGLALSRARPCLGSTIALRRAALDAIGGFTPFADRLADDYAIGEALRAHGFAIAFPPFAVAHMCTDTSLHELWQHELRWARTICSIDPAGYAGSLVAHPLAWALIAVLIVAPLASSAMLWPAVAIAIAAIVCRVALLRRTAHAYALSPQPYWLLPVRDLLSFAVFVASFLGRDVIWRGSRYRIP
jgi:ceramide glucosyltransferase